MPDTKTVRGAVERTNRDGVNVGGSWYNYGRTFQGERLGKDAAGRTVELTLIHSSKDGKSYIRAVAEVKAVSTHKPVASAPAPEREKVLNTDESAEASAEVGNGDPSPEPGSDANEPSATPEALKYAEDLALKEGWTSEEIDSLAEKRFKKPFTALTPGEASKLIVFFGGYTLTPAHSARS